MGNIYFFLKSSFFMLALGVLGIANAQPCVFISDPAFKDVNDILETDNGDVWVATQNGLLKTDITGASIQHIAPLSGINVYKLIKHDSKIWAGTHNNGLYVYDGSNWQHYTTANGLGGNTIVDFTKDNSNRLWMASSGGVVSYKNNLFSNHSIFADDSITAVNYFQGAVYAGNYNNETLKKYIGGNWHSIQASANVLYRVKQIEFGMSGELLFRNASRIYKHDGWNWNIAAMDVFDPMVKHLDGVYFITSNTDLKKYDNNGTNLIYPEICENSSMKYTHHSKGFKENSSWVAIELNGEYVIALVNYNNRPHYTELQTATLTAGVPASGLLFNNPMDKDNPHNKLKTAGKQLALLSSLWVMGESNGNNLIAAGNYILRGQDWSSGPVSSSYDYAYLNKYDRIWKVSRQQVLDFRKNYRQFSFLIPEDIRYWPGNGDTTRGEAWQLAPFVDVNHNGIYEPLDGDYPMIKGDEAVFFMINDQRGLKAASGSAPLNVEVHGMVYWFDEPGVKELEQTLFVNYRIYNRSGTVLKKFKLAMETDHQIGDPQNDLVGCDSRINLSYAYNMGSDNGPFGFGSTSPSTGWLFLSDSLSAHIGFGTAPPPYDTSPMAYPSNHQEHLNYMNNKWRDGVPLKLENPSGFYSQANGEGYTTASYPITRFQYDEKDNWAMPPPSNDEYIQLSIIDKTDLQAGAYHCLELAYTHAFGNSSSSFSSLINLKSNAAFLKQYYIDNDLGCMLSDISTEDFVDQNNLFDIYPNPAESELFINYSGNEKISSLRVLDMNGKILKIQESDFTSIDVSNLPAGVYILNIIMGDGGSQHEVFIRR